MVAFACGGTTQSVPCPGDGKWCNFASGSSPRLYHSAIWSGSELLVWGGLDNAYDEPTAKALATGVRVSLQTGHVGAMSSDGAPSPRHSHFAVWTGKEMIIWGGHSHVGGVVERATGGAVYDPSTDRWRPLAEPDGTAPVAQAVAWTGDRLWVWGGSSGGERVRRGFVYDPASEESRIITTDTPEAAVQDADAVALGGKVLLTGGKTNFPDAHPLVYDLATDAWSDAASPAPVPGTDGIGAPAFARGEVAFVCNATHARCGGYSLPSDSWQSLALTAFEAPFTYWPAWVLVDDALIFLGLVGNGSSTDGSVAAALNLDSKTWSALPSDGAPPQRRGQSATWTGSSLLFWGGATVDGASAEDGWRLEWEGR